RVHKISQLIDGLCNSALVTQRGFSFAFSYQLRGLSTHECKIAFIRLQLEIVPAGSAPQLQHKVLSSHGFNGYMQAAIFVKDDTGIAELTGLCDAVSQQHRFSRS